MNTNITIIFVFFLLIKLNTGIPSKSYYLIDLDRNSSLINNSCSNIFIDKNLYHIPIQCHRHLLCNAYQCDDKPFRCIKIRESLCCLHKYIQNYCQTERKLKEQFRSIYFHISIEHGYCEINLERIEQNDQSYCLADHFETTTSLKYIHRYRHHLTTRPMNTIYPLRQTANMTSKTSCICINSIVFVLSIRLQTNLSLFLFSFVFVNFIKF